MNKLNYNEFKSYIQKGADLCDECAGHYLTPILFKSKDELLNWLISVDKDEFFHDSVLHEDCKRLPFETFTSELVIMRSYIGDLDYEHARYTICTYIELYCDYLRLDTFVFNFAQIAQLELNGVLDENSDG
jgi:hypothetical protein